MAPSGASINPSERLQRGAMATLRAGRAWEGRGGGFGTGTGNTGGQFTKARFMVRKTLEYFARKV